MRTTGPHPLRARELTTPHPEGLTTRLVPVEVDLKQQIFDVCSSLNNGHSPKGRLRQLCATCGLTRRSKQRLFDHLGCADQARWRHGKAERLRRLQVDHELAHILLKEPPKALRGGRSDNKNADGRHFRLLRRADKCDEVAASHLVLQRLASTRL